MTELELPDTEQCQALKPNGNSFMTMGGVPGLVRCSNKPAVIITEKKPGEDDLQGSMTLCPDCLDAFNKQDDRPVTVEVLRTSPTLAR